MRVIDMLKNNIDSLKENMDQINEEKDKDFKAKEWHYYKLGSDYGTKLGRMAAYKEILEFLESDKH